MTTQSSLKKHLEVLQTRHDLLDREIQEQYSRRADDSVLKQMKVTKLRLKQKIAAMEQQTSTGK